MSTAECNEDVYKHGVSLGMFNFLKEEAEEYCRLQTQKTGCLHDWHYIGGRVHVKMLPADFHQKKSEESPWA